MLNEAYTRTMEGAAPGTQLERAPPLHVRQLSNIDKNQIVRGRMASRYKEHGFPGEFPVKVGWMEPV